MQLGKQKPTYYIGNAIMALSFFMLIATYFPVIQIYFFPPTPPAITSGEPAISIPKINAVAPLIFNIDPWDKREYETALEQGVAHAKGTGLPGQGKTTYLFAHSSSNPWQITRYNTVFLRLNELKNGDEIRISNEGQDYIYKVFDKKVVGPAEVSYLANQDKNQLIIQTCWPIGTDWKRLLVFASPQ